MKERASCSLGMVNKQVEVISIELENSLWECDILGEDTPDKLRSTVLHLLDVNCVLCAGDEHINLCRPGRYTSSQLSFELNSNNIRYLVCHKDSVTKTNRGGLHDMKKEKKINWIHPNSNINRCPVRIVGKYPSLLLSMGLDQPVPHAALPQTPLALIRLGLWFQKC